MTGLRRSFAVTLMTLALALAASPVAAQEAAATIDLGIDAALAGEQARLSVVLSTTGAPEIGSVQLEIVLPARVVTFVELSKGTGAASVAAAAKGEVSRGPGDESTLRVEVTASRPIPQGVLAAMTFQVAKDAPGDRDVKLKAAKVAVRAVDGREVRATAVDGTISVLSANSPVFACFFYMH